MVMSTIWVRKIGKRLRSHCRESRPRTRHSAISVVRPDLVGQCLELNGNTLPESARRPGPCRARYFLQEHKYCFRDLIASFNIDRQFAAYGW